MGVTGKMISRWRKKKAANFVCAMSAVKKCLSGFRIPLQSLGKKNRQNNLYH